MGSDDTSLDTLLEYNRGWADSMTRTDPEFFSRLAQQCNPYLARMNTASSANEAMTPILKNTTSSALAFIVSPQTYPSADNLLFRLACTQNTPGAASKSPTQRTRFSSGRLIEAGFCSTKR